MLFGRRKRLINRLLVVEDEPLVAFDTEHFLADNAFEIVATVDRVADARQVIERVPIDLIVLDVHLSDGTGVDVAQMAQSRSVPVLFVTGNCPPDARALAAGCLAKPYGQRDLLDAIEAIDAQIAGRRVKRMPPGFTLYEKA